MGGKSGGAGQTNNYFGTMAGAICIGPVDELVATIVNGQQVWPQGTPWSVGLAITAGTLYVFDAQTWVCTSNHTAADDNAPGSGLEGWAEYTFPRATDPYNDFTLTTSDDTYLGVRRFYWGTAAQTVDFYLQAANNDGGVKGNLGLGDTHPDYQGLSYSVPIDFLFGQEIQSGPNIEDVVRRAPNQSLLTGAAATIVDGQANLAAVAVEWLTNENCLGEPDSLIDLTSFQATADFLQSNQEKYGASVLVDSLEDISALFEKITLMIDGYFRFNNSTRKIEMGVYKHGETPASYTTLTADAFTKFPKFSIGSWQETTNAVVVNYASRQLNYQNTSTPPIVDARGFFVLGQVRSQTLDRPWICRPQQAMIHGRETLRVIGHAKMTGTLEVRREIGRAIRAGDYVLVDIDLEPGGTAIYQFFRVTQRKLNPTGPVTLSVFADNTLAPIPWHDTSSPVMVATPAVPPITSFRVLEVPTVLSGQRGAIIVLAQRPNNIIIGNNVYFDTDPAGTFSLLGSAGNFAAKATLHTAVAATDAALDVDVDVSQVDAEYFTQQYTDLEAADDTMLAFIVSTVSGGAESGQVDESAGFQIVEICSVSAQSLTSAGRYSLTVLRGRKNTVATAFTTANTEVWLIPAALLTYFTFAPFDTIRANRLLGTTPDHAQFRFCPYTFASALALADATSHAFRFPLNSASAPSLTLTSPGWILTYTGVTTFPFSINVKGSWNDPDGNLVQHRILLRLSSESSDRVLVNQVFIPTTTKAFNTYAQIDKPGTWAIKLIARDATNLVTERDIAVNVSGTGGAKCAPVDVFDAAGEQILNANGNVPTSGSAYPNRFIPFGVLNLKCSTPGAVIHFHTSGVVFNSGAIIEAAGDWVYAEGTVQPFHGLMLLPPLNIGGLKGYTLRVSASAPGYADSAAISFSIPLYY